MAKQRPSLEAFAQSAVIPSPPLVVVGAPPHVVESVSLAEPSMKARKDRPHTTLYLSKKAQRVIKEIALQYDRKPHDLYLEGINLMLAHYGRPSVEDLSKD
jgi:hypothetical protein